MSNRIKVINSEIQKVLSNIIMQEVKNPKITGIISVASVETTKDLEFAKVLVSIFTKDDKEDVLNEIKHSAGFIRKQLSQKLNLRKTPYLQFYLDTSAEHNDKIAQVISEIQKERESKK